MNSNPLDSSGSRGDQDASVHTLQVHGIEEQETHWQAEEVRAASVISGESDALSQDM